MFSSPTAPDSGARPLRRDTAWIVGAAGLLAVVGIAGCGGPATSTQPTTTEAVATSALSTTSSRTPSTTTTTPTGAAVPEPAAAVALSVNGTGAANTALAQLDTLPVKGRAPKTGYDRALFGQAWSDDVTVAGGHNGCDTRNDILRRDLADVTLKPGSNGCTVLTGTLADSYTGTTVAFTRGSGTSRAVEIDHVVALSDSWQKGSQQLDEQTRRNFANDPRNLQAVDGPTNQRKGDGDAATWLPPNKEYRCTYVSRQIEVKAAYNLWVTAAERDAMARVLGDCGAAPARVVPAADPTEHRQAVTTVPPAPAPRSAPAPAAAPVPFVAPPAPAPAAALPAPSATVSYASCSAVRAAGAAPIYAGQPGYSRKLDRDGDGVACE
ncbi:GmrSD restriction endonuclease domain-containing protein [Rhodococcus spelaei]|uniref:GmrSD restriction endonuclease domain-containing protein n=1 Tax=Rhodococcus spelaei TaxID=2546320 RepID=UPI001FE430C2|nr:DUF1524 domain-containing protein [Rhodococcus spelaei]